MDPRPDDLRMLLALHERGSFTAAAASRGVSQGTASRAVQRLEEGFDTPLVLRNSRQVCLTEAGTRIVALARSWFEALDVERERAGVSAALHVTCAPSFGRRWLVPRLPKFLREHPGIDLRLELTATTRTLDAVDVAIRFGPLPDSALLATCIARSAYRVYAAPGVPQPTTVCDLAHLPCLVLDATHLRDRWPFAVTPSWQRVRTALRCDDVDALIQLAVAGQGLVMVPDLLVTAEVEDGRLLHVPGLPDDVPVEVYAVRDPHRATSATEAFLRFLHVGKAGESAPPP